MYRHQLFSSIILILFTSVSWADSQNVIPSKLRNDNVLLNDNVEATNMARIHFEGDKMYINSASTPILILSGTSIILNSTEVIISDNVAKELKLYTNEDIQQININNKIKDKQYEKVIANLNIQITEFLTFIKDIQISLLQLGIVDLSDQIDTIINKESE